MLKSCTNYHLSKETRGTENESREFQRFYAEESVYAHVMQFYKYLVKYISKRNSRVGSYSLYLDVGFLRGLASVVPHGISMEIGRSVDRSIGIVP